MAARRKASSALVPSSLRRIASGLKAEVCLLWALKARNRSEGRALLILASSHDSASLARAFALAYQMPDVRMCDVRWPQLRDVLMRLPLCAFSLAKRIDADRELYRRVERWANKLDCRTSRDMALLGHVAYARKRGKSEKEIAEMLSADKAEHRLAMSKKPRKEKSKKVSAKAPFLRCGRIDAATKNLCNRFIIEGETCRAHEAVQEAAP